MRIDSNGNVSIKEGKLSIGQSSENNIAYTTGETWIGSNGLRYNSGSDTFARSSATSQAAMMVLTTTADVEFYAQPSTSQTGTYALSPKMVIKGATGNVGIGTGSPIGKLDILGVAGSVGSLGQLNRAGINLRIPNVLNQYTQIAFSNDGGGAFGYGAIGMVMTSTSGVGLGDMIFSTKGLGTDVVSTQRARITSGGNFIIGTETSTSCTLKVSSTKNGSASSPHFCITGNGYTALQWLDTVAYFIVTNSASRDIRIAANNNGVKLTPGATSWVSNSDISLKENLKPLDNVLDKIKDYRCIEYNLKNTPEDKKIGFIAQDWENDFAPIVDKDDKGLLGMKYTETIPVLLKAIQELKAEIEILKNKSCTCNNCNCNK